MEAFNGGGYADWEKNAEGKEIMSRVSGRPWTSQDGVLLRDPAAAGKHVVTIAVEMNRSESVIRKRAKDGGLKIVQKTKGKPKRTAAETSRG
jgi:hypothetical protein